jgi:molybdopterin molybdotransferase
MLAVEEALKRIVAGLTPLPPEWVHLGAAHGRVLARDLVASRDQPPHAISAMDGYAVRAADLADGGATLRLIGAAPAGATFEGAIGPGETVRIFTGGGLPTGADAIALQENAAKDGDQVRLEGRVEPGTYVRPAGLDFRQGEVALAAGERLGARNLGLAAALNHAWLPVRRRPRVAVLATGDELVMPGQPLAAHQIVNSNSTALAAMVAVWGGEAHDLGIVADRPEELAAIAPHLEGFDLVVTAGGASVGERDLVRSVLGEHGFELDFWQIAMRPGKPLMFGRIRGVPMLGLPGNPVSAGVCAILFVRAAIRALLGMDPALPELAAILGAPLAANDRRQDYLRAHAAWREDGRIEVHPAPRQDSSMLAVFARATCLIKRPPLAPALAAGATVPVVLLASDPLCG